jgi:hypothetical protein
MWTDTSAALKGHAGRDIRSRLYVHDPPSVSLTVTIAGFTYTV